MKGIFLNEFYSAIGNIKTFLIIVCCMAIGVILTGNLTFEEIFAYIVISAFPVNAIVSMRKNEVSNWNRYELTLPIRRKDIIKCRYLSYLAWVIISTIATMTIILLTSILHKNTLENFHSMLILGIGISMTIGAVYYLLSYILGVEKSETILIMSSLASIGLSIYLVNTISRLNLGSYMHSMIYMSIIVFIYFISFLCAKKVYQKKEIK